MKKLLIGMLVAAALLSGTKAGAYETYSPTAGWVWEPAGWNYVSGDYVYSVEDGSWMYILREEDGPWSYSYVSSAWYDGLFGGWSYFMLNASTSSYSDYYYYNLDVGAWYYLYTGPGLVYYYNFTRGHWGTIY